MHPRPPLPSFKSCGPWTFRQTHLWLQVAPAVGASFLRQLLGGVFLSRNSFIFPGIPFPDGESEGQRERLSDLPEVSPL